MKFDSLPSAAHTIGTQKPDNMSNCEVQKPASAGRATVGMSVEIPPISQVPVTQLGRLRNDDPHITGITAAKGPKDPFHQSAQRASYPAQARAVLTKAFLQERIGTTHLADSRALSR